MKRVKEVSEIIGVSRRTLQYYDDEKLISIKRTGENHRIYDEENMEALWEILLYKEMNFKLKEVKHMKNMLDKEFKSLMEEKLKELSREKNELAAQIRFACAIKKYGLPPPCIDEEGQALTYVQCITALKKALSMGEDEIRKSYDKDGKDYKFLLNKVKFRKTFLEWVRNFDDERRRFQIFKELFIQYKNKVV